MNQPQMPAGQNAREALAVPSLLVGLCGALGLLGSASLIGGHALLLRALARDPRFNEVLAREGGSGGLVLPVLWLGLSCVLVVGALKMRSLQSYSLALVASVLAMLPCGGCFCIGLPVGIWALITLRKPEIKGQFQG